MSQPEPATAGFPSSTMEVGSVFVSNYPPYSAWTPEAVPRALAALAAPPTGGRIDRGRAAGAPAGRPAAAAGAAAGETPLGLYLHVPFCRKRCKFCYFRVYTDKNGDEVGRYVDALAREVELYAARPALGGRRLRFVYFGGGTPSFISVRHLEALAARVRAAFPWDGVEEVTFECEPGTLTRSKLAAIRGIGVTRLSLGIESFDDEILRANGRAHLAREIERVLPWIRDLAFPQLNVDLIAGMVGESWESWRATVGKTIDVGADSVTVYQLELPFNARFSRELQAGRLDAPLADWETKRAWHDYAFERLAAAGYRPSSAYTMVRPGPPGGPGDARGSRDSHTRFVYRDALWHGADLLGTGVASFSHFQGVHFQNTAGWRPYLEGVEAGRLPLDRAFVTSPEERLTRELILQLKLGAIEAAPFRAKFGVDVLARFGPAWARLEREGMLRVENGARGRVELTRRGLLQVDSLLPAFYQPRYRGARYT
jgi:oxygen-independent coproporphyrinogen-3 oxidase